MGKKRTQSSRKTPQRVQEQSESEEEYEIEKILDRRTRGGVVEYFLKWKGFSSLENSWEPENNLNCQDLIDEFNLQYDSKNKIVTPEEDDSEEDEPLQKKSKIDSTLKSDTTKNSSEGRDDSDGTAEEDKAEKNEDSDSNSKKRKSKSMGRGKFGFDRGWEVDEILGATHSYGKLHFLISWKRKDQAELVPAKLAHAKCPQAVIDYYESRLQWCDREEKAENNTKSNTEETPTKSDAS